MASPGRIATADDVGKRVQVDGYAGKGTIMFCGMVELANKTRSRRFGIKMDDAVGKNDGTLGSKRYFQCSQGHGLFISVKSERVTMARRSSNKAAKSRQDPSKKQGVQTTSAVKKPQPKHGNKIQMVDPRRNSNGASKPTLAEPNKSSKRKGRIANKSDVGKRVVVDGYPGKGILRFCGVIAGDPQFRFGIELDGAHGRNDGSALGTRYFTCQPGHGVFVPVSLDRVYLAIRSTAGTGHSQTPESTQVKRKIKKLPVAEIPDMAGIAVGARCTLKKYKCGGTIRWTGKFPGESQFKVGVELDRPLGKNNGLIRNQFRLFKCADNHGVVTLPEQVTINMPTDSLESRLASSNSTIPAVETSKVAAVLEPPAVTSQHTYVNVNSTDPATNMPESHDVQDTTVNEDTFSGFEVATGRSSNTIEIEDAFDGFSNDNSKPGDETPSTPSVQNTRHPIEDAVDSSTGASQPELLDGFVDDNQEPDLPPVPYPGEHQLTSSEDSRVTEPQKPSSDSAIVENTSGSNENLTQEQPSPQKPRRRRSSLVLPQTVVETGVEPILIALDMHDRVWPALREANITTIPELYGLTFEKLQTLSVSRDDAERLLYEIEREKIKEKVAMKLGTLMANKSGAEIITMLSSEELTLAVDPDELEDLLESNFNIVRVDGKSAPNSADELFEIIDADHNGTVSLSEFLAFTQPNKDQAILQDNAEVVEAVKSASLDPSYSGPLQAGAAAERRASVVQPEVDMDGYYVSESEDEESGDEWYWGLFEDDEPDGTTNEDDGPESDSVDDGKEENATENLNDDGENDGDDEIEDDEDEEDGLPSGPSYKYYSNIPARVFTGLVVPPKTSPEVGELELHKSLSKLIKLRKAYVKMGEKRSRKKGVKRREELNELGTNILSEIKSVQNINATDKKQNSFVHHCCSDPTMTRDILKALIDAGANLDQCDKDGRTPIHVAVSNGHHRFVQKLIDGGANVNVISKKGEVPLIMTFQLKKAKKDVDLKMAEVLVRSGTCNLDVGSDESAKKPQPSPLIQLLQKKHPDRSGKMVHLLTSHGCDPNVRTTDKKKRSALWIALDSIPKSFNYAADCIGRRNDVDGAISLQPEVYNEPSKKKGGTPPLFNLCAFKQSAAIMNLLALKADGNKPGEKFKAPPTKFLDLPVCTAFEAAVLSGAGNAVEKFLDDDESRFKPILVQPPSDWNKKWKPIENIPLICSGVVAANHGEATSFAKMCIKYDVSVNEPMVEGCSLFMIMTAVGHTAGAKYLLDKGVTIDINLKDEYDRNIVWFAAFAKDDDRTPMLRASLVAGADPSCKDRDGITPVLAAARSGNVMALVMLRNQPFEFKDPTVRNSSYKHPGKKGFPDVKHTGVLRRGTFDKSITPQNKSSSVPIWITGQTINKFEREGNMMYHPLPAFTPGNWTGVNAEDLTAEDNFGLQPIWYAVLNKNADMVRFLVENGVDYNWQPAKATICTRQMTPIMLAACVKARGKLDIFFYLLKQPDIDLNRTDSRGFTLFDIVYMEEVEFVFRPMTDALRQRGLTWSKSISKLAKLFDTHDMVNWSGEDTDDKKAKKLPNGQEEWKSLLKKIPFFEDAYWLRSMFKYDQSGRQEARREKTRQRTEMAKLAGFAAAIAAAKIGGALMGGGGSILTAGINYAKTVWKTSKSAMIRGYDMEYYLAMKEDRSLQPKTDQELMARMHIPEDFDCKRYHIGRYHRVSDSPSGWNKLIKAMGLVDEKGKYKRVRWVQKNRTLDIVADGSG